MGWQAQQINGYAVNVPDVPFIIRSCNQYVAVYPDLTEAWGSTPYRWGSWEHAQAIAYALTNGSDEIRPGDQRAWSPQSFDIDGNALTPQAVDVLTRLGERAW